MSADTWKELRDDIRKRFIHHDEFPDWPKIAEDLCERIEELKAEVDALTEEVSNLEAELLRAEEERA